MSHKVTFVPSGRGKARCPADPAYPHGIALDISEGVIMCCKVELPYPAPECGHFQVVCDDCGFSLAITAAGRPDDPVSILLPCKKKARQS